MLRGNLAPKHRGRARGMAVHSEGYLRQRLIGALASFGFLSVVMGSITPFLGDAGPIAIVARINDSLSPYFLLAGLLMAGLVAMAGAVRLALVLVGAALLAALVVFGPVLGQARPLVAADDGAVRIIWFNVLFKNAQNAERIADAVIAAAPDVVVFGESSALGRVKDRLEAEFPYSMPCENPCELLLMAREPFAEGQLRALGGFSPQRYAQVTFGDSGLTLAAIHLLKPWYQGIAESDRKIAIRRLGRIDGPLVVVGDTNAAPWSLTMRRIFAETGLHPPRRPVGTWPASLGRLGLPIDHVLVKGGARLTRLEPFGEELGSNHRGLLAEIVIGAE